MKTCNLVTPHLYDINGKFWEEEEFYYTSHPQILLIHVALLTDYTLMIPSLRFPQVSDHWRIIVAHVQILIHKSTISVLSLNYKRQEGCQTTR